MNANHFDKKIKLFMFPRLWGLPSASPFSSKVEAYLRLTGVDYEPCFTTDTRSGPKSKLPYLADQGRKIGDSTLIIDHLKATRGDALDQTLTSQQIALSQAIQSMLEEHLYWAALWLRWIDDDGWRQMQPYLFQSKSWPLRKTLLTIARRMVRNELWQAGMGRHQAKEVIAFGQRDITALATLLGEQPFLLGEKPHTIDAVATSFVGAIWFTPWQNPLTEQMQQHENLQRYYERFVAQLFPELPSKPQHAFAARAA